MVTSDFVLTAPPERTSRKRLGGWTWGPSATATHRFISSGGGIQSTTMQLMAAHGEIDGPLPDAAIYAPVGDAEATRDNIRWLASGNVLPFPVYELSDAPISLRQSIENRATANGQRYVTIPAHLEGPKRGMDRRQCTREYKVDRLTAAHRRLMGYKPRQRIPQGSAEVWIGFSTDEVVRAGAAFQPWIVHRYPLLEKRMSLSDCVAWLTRNGYPVPPRSKCTFCPYREDAEWLWLKENEPAAFADAVAIDAMIRDTPGMRARSYLHASRRPLGEVEFDPVAASGQGMLMLCEAGCGV